MLGRGPEGVRGAAFFCLKRNLRVQRYGCCCLIGGMLTGVSMDDRYVRIELDLVHVKNALETLSAKRDEFPLGTVIRDPAYWRSRLQSIRSMADRYNYRNLRDRSDELLNETSKLQFWAP